MQINVSGHQVAVTPALREYATGKLERIVRHFDHLHDVTVTLSVEKLLQKAEATLRCANSKIIHADAQATDLLFAGKQPNNNRCLDTKAPNAISKWVVDGLPIRHDTGTRQVHRVGLDDARQRRTDLSRQTADQSEGLL